MNNLVVSSRILTVPTLVAASGDRDRVRFL